MLRHANHCHSDAMSSHRIERDSLGEVQLPATALYGAQTQRAINNFRISGQPLPRPFLRALGLIKAACAHAAGVLGHLPLARAQAIEAAALAVAAGDHDAEFPIDVFQTGSGTSSNMNANEVIAALASRSLGSSVHANDEVNFAQSSNDVIPSAIQVGAALLLEEGLRPSLKRLRSSIEQRASGLQAVVKTGRTHLMDAMPITLAQEFGCWAAQLASCDERLRDVEKRLTRLPLGGTAVGTGINAPDEHAGLAIGWLAAHTPCAFEPAPNRFEGIAGQDVAVELSGQLKTLACVLMKIANDLRWMNSGPLGGLGEIELPALQPGSSIMPGKVNPVIPEAVAMVAAQVIGNDAAISVAGASGNFQLNVMLPLVARNLLESLQLLAAAMEHLARHCIDGLSVRQDRLQQTLARNPILVTALNPILGYERAAALAKQAYREGRPILDVVAEATGMPRAELAALLDPLKLTQGGIRDGLAGGG